METPKRIAVSRSGSLLVAAAVLAGGCYVHHRQSDVLVPGLDVDQTLEVARMEMEKNSFSTVLTLWAMRNQIIDAEHAAVIARLYFTHIDRIDSEAQNSREFSVWHLTWAVSDMYRLGDEGVRFALQAAYDDAAVRVEALDKRIATRVFHDEEMLMGDIHGGGRGYARKHLVVPGNDRYLQSVDDYLENERSER